LFAWAALRFPPVYQRQALAVLLGALVPWAGNLIYVAGLSPAPGLELAPLLLVFSGIVIAWNIFRFGLLNLVPVARDALIETMPDGLVVLDEQGRVVDINPAARNLLAVPAAQVLGRPAFEALAVWPALSQACVALAGHVEIRLEESGPAGGPARYYDLQTTPLHNRSGALTGKLLMLRDITQRKRLEEQLRQQATTDELTRVANRRHFLEAAQSEIRRAQRLMYPLALAVIDLDHFKQINDTYGHAGGDQALVAFAKICQPLIREIDLFARIGGDEFALLLPGATGAQAGNVVERVRAALAAGPLKRDGQRVAITLSVGIACLLDGPESLEALLARADGALYQAKEAGRNRVVLAPEPPRSRRRPEAALIK
jgi:diguanylate cyclase (GGDEF)-like protein/PAS domain S-box-containing protein